MKTDIQNGLEKNEKHFGDAKRIRTIPMWSIPGAFFLVEIFAIVYLSVDQINWWPLVFGVLWSGIMTGIIAVFPPKAGRILFGILYFLIAAYAVVQTGYYILFGEMMWISDFRYASEGSEFFSVLLQYPLSWWLWTVGLLVLGVLMVWKFPASSKNPVRKAVAALIALAAVCGAVFLPELVFRHDRQVQYAGSDYGRAQSAEAAYDNMFNTHRLYQVCGVYQTAFKDLYRNMIYPMTPGHALAQSKAVDEIDSYFAARGKADENEMTGIFKGKNLIMISAEAFTAEVIDPILTPTLYRMATKGINFTDYYQPASAGTTGGEYQNIFGMLPTAGGKSFKNTAGNLNYFTMGSQLNRLGYYGKAFHNNSYTYYSRNKTHVNLGYSDGFMGYGNGMEAYVKKAWPQSDYEMFSGTLPTYIDKEHFNVYYMTVSGHSNYTKSGNSMTKRHWDRVAHLPYSDTVKGYLAANLDFEDALTYLVAELEAKGIADDTVICISTDHFPYGLDNDAKLGDMPYLSELYGYEVTNYFQRDHSRLIIWSGCLETMDPIVVDTPTFGCDILPTLSNLFGLEYDSRLMVGRDVFSDAMPLVWNANYEWKTELGTYYATKGKFVPATEDTVVPEDYVKSIKAIVKNKMTYSSGVLKTDYFRLLFG